MFINKVYRRTSVDSVLSLSIMGAKEEVAALLKGLPDDCSLEDIQYHLYVLEKVKAGREEAERHGTLTQEEVEKRLSKWLAE